MNGRRGDGCAKASWLPLLLSQLVLPLCEMSEIGLSWCWWGNDKQFAKRVSGDPGQQTQPGTTFLPQVVAGGDFPHTKLGDEHLYHSTSSSSSAARCTQRP